MMWPRRGSGRDRRSGRRPMLLVAAGLTVLLATELVLRLAFHERLKICAYPLVYQPDESLGFRYMPNATGRLSIPGIDKEFPVNSQGFLGEDFVKERQPGVLRIAVVGTSQSTGIWMAGTVNYAARLEQNLAAAGVDCEVLNFSIDGRQRDQFLLNLLANDVAEYQPDLVFLELTPPLQHASVSREPYRGYTLVYDKSVQGSREACREQVDRYETQLRYRAYELSYLVRAACRLYLRFTGSRKDSPLDGFILRRVAGETRIYPLDPADYVRALEEISRRCHLNIRLLVLSAHDTSRTLVDRFGLPHVAIDLPDDEDLRNQEEEHLNEAGHRFIADRLADFVRSQGLLLRAAKRE